ncbi:hypothetical protein [Pseudarthrobacter sp. SSS035]|uniref:hypothetical protein n=1 Tax=Pseudarthrobacter sp. SSS035 TaxID=2931399 RepID=UPI00200C24B0|nr:hypothetical protein [Pseudarthrobacter sp. SSS035]
MTSTATPLRITVWNENVHETSQPEIAAIYPHGIHGAIAEGLGTVLGTRAEIRTATLADAEHGLPEEVLAATDVLLWWGHRSGVTFTRGNGKILYFSPGDQKYPIYYRQQIRQVLANAVQWAAPAKARSLPSPVHTTRMAQPGRHIGSEFTSVPNPAIRRMVAGHDLLE